MARSVTKDEYSELQLKNVKTRKEMKAWIKKFKSDESAQDRVCCVGCCGGYRFGWAWLEKQFGTKVCRCGEMRNREPLDKNTKQIPMDLWSWKNVVAVIEHAKYRDENGEEIKLNHFSSVFWQYMIEGKELVVMDVLQIELLVEVWFIDNDIEERAFDDAKLEAERGGISHIRAEAERLMEYIDRQRIHSHIASRYQLSMVFTEIFVVLILFPFR